MRRIFGGANLTGSSTSTSLASDALPSPNGAPPQSANTLLSDQLQQLQQQQQASGVPSEFGGNHEEPARAKGWFESALTGVSGTLGVGTVVGKPAGGKDKAAAASPSTQEEEEYAKLPFGASRALSPTNSRLGDSASSYYKSPPRQHGRDPSNQSNRQSLEGGENSREMIMVELLSGQAVVEAKDYQILDWDEMQEVKKEHNLLATRTASLSRSLALETKLRESAAKMVRLSAPSTASPLSNSQRPRATKEQAEAQLATATAKVAALSAELYRSGWKEAALRTRLLQHTAAVLALTVRRKEELDQGAPVSPLPAPLSSTSHSSKPSNLSHPPTTNRDSPSPSSQSDNSQQPARFDGAHFFAGNREAIQPSTTRRLVGAGGSNSSVLGSPFVSPQLGGSANGGFGALPTSSSSNPADAQTIRELEEKVAALQQSLMSAQTALETAHRDVLTRTRDHEDLGSQHDALSKERDALGEELDQTKSALMQRENDVEDVRSKGEIVQRELEALQDEHGAVCEEKESLQMRLEQLQSTHEGVVQHRDLLVAGGGAGAGEGDLKSKLSMMSLDVEEAEHRAESAEERLAEAEEELAGVRRELEDSLSSHRDVLATSSSGSEEVEALKGQLAAKSDEKRRLLQAVGDVLRRHRTRGVVGPVLRDLPAFDDEGKEGSELAGYVGDSLDGHFGALAGHVQSFEKEKHDVASEREAKDSELQQLREEVDSHRQAKDELESNTRNLQSQLDQHQSTSSSTTHDLALLREEDAKKASQVSTLQTQLTTSEAALAEASANHAKALKGLQDLWRSMPPLDTRVASANSDDLAVLKSAFEAPRRPMGNFLADVTSTGKFTVESLTERVKVLLAEDSRLVGKLMAIEGGTEKREKEAKEAKEEGEKAAAKLKENMASMAGYQKQIKELEERMEVSANQEVTMLERLNDLTESVETARGEKRKIEASLAAVQTQLSTAEAERTRLSSSLSAVEAQLSALSSKPNDSAKVAELEATISDLRDSQTDLEEELEDAKKREQKQRSQLLEQLSAVEQEVSSLKTQLRQAQRKKPTA